MREPLAAVEPGLDGIAIIGMSGRFPGAATVHEFWENLRAGVESIRPLTEPELAAAGVAPELRCHPQYVRAGSHIEDVEWFDAGLFGYTPRDAELMDPQHRVLLECAWEALEHAGHAPSLFGGKIGVYAGSSMNSYLLRCVIPARERLAPGGFQLLLSSDKDYLATRISYKLGLKGPSLAVQTACSTSLVAVHLACQSLLTRECDAALAGGVSIGVPQRTGYLYEPGGILSPDGHCRAFGAGAAGTVPGDGAGLVVLRRLEDALADGDTVYAVIRGSAVNNDGSAKVGFTAPSIDGQAEVVAEAQALAGVPPGSIGYVEAHGTGTALGDPIELQALTRAMRLGTDRVGYCALGSVKSNIGHLDAAAGVAGLIKATLCLHHGEIPPTLHAMPPHPEIPFASSPFYLPSATVAWPRTAAPRRAGVSSFGIGGTNAHVVLEEAPPASKAAPSGRARHLLILSAHSKRGLEQSVEALAEHLRQHPSTDLADASFTLALGRQPLPQRLAVVASDPADAVEALGSRACAAHQPLQNRTASFLFPGQGAQHPEMASYLYRTEPLFRETFDDCCAQLGIELRGVLFSPPEDAAARLTRTDLAHPALFVVEYALARLWMHWGVRPAALLGHGVGEYAAACVAGVFSPRDALRLVALQGQLLQSSEPGTMLGVPLPESELLPLLGAAALSLAAVNTPSLCVVAGSPDAVQSLARALLARGVESHPLDTSHVFHSSLVEPALAPFREAIAAVELQPPAVPVVSSLYGRVLRAQEATDPDYWARHLRQTVRFADGLAALAQLDDGPLLEVGPSDSLSAFARLHPATAGRACLASLRHPSQPPEADAFTVPAALGRLWLAGVSPDWSAFHASQLPRRRLPLPTCRFQRARYWIDPPGAPAREAAPVKDPPAPRHARPELGSPYEAPRNALEARLVSMWERFFGVSPIGIHDDFLELGGHSLLATQVLASLQDALQLQLPLSLLFSHPTIASLAEQLGSASPANSRGVLAPCQRLPPGAPPPLSFAQDALARSVLAGEPGCKPACVVVAWKLIGPLDAAALERSIREIVARHDTFRATFHREGERLFQRISPEVHVRLASKDLQALPQARRFEAVRDVSWRELDRSYDLAQGPLFFPTLLRLDREEHVLVIAMHHLAGDGSSIGVLADELVALYPAHAGGRCSPLPPPAFQYADFAHWQRAALQSEALDHALSWWEATLRGPLPLLDMPLDRPRPRVATWNGTRHLFSLSRELSAGIRRRAQQEGVTLFMFLLAAWAVVLGRRSGQQDLLVGSPSDGRQGMPEGMAGLIGRFVNLLPLRVNLSGLSTTRDLLHRVRAVVTGAFDHPPPPLDLLVQELRRRRVFGEPPVIRAGLILYSEPLVSRPLGDLTLAPLPVGTRVSHFELSLAVTEEDELQAFIEYNTDLFAERTIVALAQDVVQACREMSVSAPTSTGSSLS